MHLCTQRLNENIANPREKIFCGIFSKLKVDDNWRFHKALRCGFSNIKRRFVSAVNCILAQISRRKREKLTANGNEWLEQIYHYVVPRKFAALRSCTKPERTERHRNYVSWLWLLQQWENRKYAVAPESFLSKSKHFKVLDWTFDPQPSTSN